MGKTISKAIIFAGGEVENYDGIRPFIKEDEYIICADSGYRHCQMLDVTPDLLVGDFDSISSIPTGIETITLPQDKNYTDSALAIEEAKQRGAKMFMLIGMLGGRIDHSIANIQSMFGIAQQGFTVCMQDGNASIYPYYSPDKNHPVKFLLPPRKDCYFSLLSFSQQCEDVTIADAKYLLDHYHLTNTEARAVSNEFLEVPAKISFHSGMLMVVVTKK